MSLAKGSVSMNWQRLFCPHTGFLKVEFKVFRFLLNQILETDDDYSHFFSQYAQLLICNIRTVIITKSAGRNPPSSLLINVHNRLKFKPNKLGEDNMSKGSLYLTRSAMITNLGGCRGSSVYARKAG